MLEEITMEKSVQKRYLSTASKSSSVESFRGKQDVPKRAHWASGGGKGYDDGQFPHRPNPRRLSQLRDRRTDQQPEDDLDEEAATAVTKYKHRHRLNLQLNFKYARYNPAHGHRRFSPPEGKGHRHTCPSLKHSYSKEQFLQANCQFVVQDGQDYSVYAADADLLVDWDCVEEVRFASHEATMCPICLEPPIAGKMTRCGHIYCWPCILHYMSLTEGAWGTCPICYQGVHRSELKSVVSSVRPDCFVGQSITMQLMYLERGSVVSRPVARWRKGGHGRRPVPSVLDACYSKLLPSTQEQVLHDVVGRERAELSIAWELTRDDPEVCFVEESLELLKERHRKLMDSIREQASVPRGSVPNEDGEGSGGSVRTASFSDDQTAAVHDQATDGCVSESETSAPVGWDLADAMKGLAVVHNSPRLMTSLSLRYFYQAIDGRHVYLTKLNVDMLEMEYGPPDRWPDVLTGEIVEKEMMTMNEVLRRRICFLGHLPLTCEFEIVELRFCPPLVSQRTLDRFAEKIEMRSSRRNERALKEKLREEEDRLRAEERNREMIEADGHRPRYSYDASFNFDSLADFPKYDPRPNIRPEWQDGASPPLSAPIWPVARQSSCPADPSAASGSLGVSFAEILREGNKKRASHKTTAWRRRGDSDPSEGNGGGGNDINYDDGGHHVHQTNLGDFFSESLQHSLENASCPGERGKGGRRTRMKRMRKSVDVN